MRRLSDKRSFFKNWYSIAVAAFFVIIIGGGLMVSLILDDTSERELRAYMIQDVGLQVRYPAQLSVTPVGSNDVERRRARGEQVSGTRRAISSQLEFRQDGTQVFTLSLFRNQSTPTEIHENNFAALSYYGQCDRRWGFVKRGATQLTGTDGPVLRVSGVMGGDEETRRNCYYFRVADGLGVVSTVELPPGQLAETDSIVQTIMRSSRYAKEGERSVRDADY